MNINEFIEDKVLEFPTDQTGKTYLETIKEKFRAYKDNIKSLDGKNSFIVKRNYEKIHSCPTANRFLQWD